MAFYEIQFPADISYGASGGPSFNTIVAVVDSGYEVRNISWSAARCKFDVSQAIKSQAQMDTLVAFFRAMHGRGHGFRYKDWEDYRSGSDPAWANEPLPFGTSANIQLIKTYTQSGNEVRTITKPVAGTVTARKNGVSTPITVNTVTGVITLTAGAPLITDVIDWTGQFDIPARFDIDEMKTTIDAPGVYTWGRIPIIEIRV